MKTLSPVRPTTAFPRLVSSGVELDPAHMGRLTDSTSLLGDTAALRERMEADGYLYLPGYLGRAGVLEARREVVRRLEAAGHIKPGTDPMDAILNPALNRHSNFQPDLARGNAPLHTVLYAGSMIDLYERLLGGAVRHYDFTWLRSVGPGKGTPSHLDSVYMNRGTHRVFTAWVPLGDVSFQLGGLMVLPGTHRNQRLKETYGMQDVDAFCENKPDAKSWGKPWGTGGHLRGDPNQIRRSVAGAEARWLTADFRAGDLLTFTIFTMHASLDNTTADRIRFSSDSRYQLASEPADERWVSVDGRPPSGHTDAARRGKIC
jgi:hypothetical protein